MAVIITKWPPFPPGFQRIMAVINDRMTPLPPWFSENYGPAKWVIMAVMANALVTKGVRDAGCRINGTGVRDSGCRINGTRGAGCRLPH